MMTATMEAFRRSLEGKDGAEITEIAVSLFSAKKDLEIRLKEFQNASSAMALEYQQMKDELNGARKEIDALRKQNQHLTGIQTIQTNELFGRHEKNYRSNCYFVAASVAASGAGSGGVQKHSLARRTRSSSSLPSLTIASRIEKIFSLLSDSLR